MIEKSGNALAVTDEAVEALIRRGIRNRWYAVCPSSFVGREPVGLQRAGERLVLWRGDDRNIHALEDLCPHRGAPLSVGRAIAGGLECRYHGVQVSLDGTVLLVPGSPGCSLEGKRLVRAFPICEVAGAVFVWFGDELHAEPTPFVPPHELVAAEYSRFLCYAEWETPYLLSMENNVDPMHGAFLHRDSHTMSMGQAVAKFQIREVSTGFMFEKVDQRDVNFDWAELVDGSAMYIRLEIPYPESAGPGGNFGIIHFATPISDYLFSGFWWRTRKVSGWERAAWRFLYANRIEERHYAVLEQDRAMLEAMSCEHGARENLYSHDLGVVRFRRKLRSEARAQLEALARGTA